MSEQQSVNALVERLSAWVLQQPEYPLLFLSNRQTRRRAADIIAKRLMMLPHVKPNTNPTREEVRAAEARLKKMVGPMKTQQSRRAARMKAKALRDHKRNQRLSAERLAELVDRAYEEPQYQYDESDSAYD